MNSKIFTKLLPYMIMSSLILNGCGIEKADCNLPNEHVHLYTKDMNDGTTISRYQESERLNDYGWTWHEDFIEVNKDDAQFYKKLDEGDHLFNTNLFNGIDNFDYLYNQMASDEDYLEYYYEKETVVVHYVYDDKGNVIDTYTEVQHDEGWHKNQFDSDNTGKVRLCHQRYYAFRPVMQNGKWDLMKSKEVDDIREVLDEYPYVSEDFSTTVYKEHKYLPIQLLTLKAEDLIEDFNHPDLENKTSTLNKTRTR